MLIDVAILGDRNVVKKEDSNIKTSKQKFRACGMYR